MLSPDRARAFGWRLVLSALLYGLLFVNSVWLLLTYPDADALMIFENAGVVGLLSPVMPLVAALPGALLFAQDVRSGFCTLLVCRAQTRRYLRSKIVAAFSAGALATALGMLLFILLVNCLFPPDFSAAPAFIDCTGFRALLGGGGTLSYIGYYAARLALQALAGGAYALVALAFSAYWPSVPLTLCMPLVLYRVLDELADWPGFPWHLNPNLLADGAAGLEPLPTLLWALLVFLSMSSLCAALFVARAKRRLHHG